MSAFERLRSGLSRVADRFFTYRDAAERERERREQEAARRVEEDPRSPERTTAGAGAEAADPTAGGGHDAAVAAERPMVEGDEDTRPTRARTSAASIAAAHKDARADVEAGHVPPTGYHPGASPAAGGVPNRPTPAEALPWGLRVASELGWRLLVIAATVWILVQVIGAISLLVISFAAGLLITALLQPFTGRLKRMGLGRGAATAVTSFTGFGVIGLGGWFVVWQVMENVEDLVESVTEGINELRDWVLDSPFGVSDEDMTQVVDNVNQWIGEHSAELTTAGLEGANYAVRFFTGAGVTLFVVLFLLYDGRNIWYWFLKFIPASARPAVAGAGPRAWITLTGYVRGTLLVALIDAIGIGLGLYILQVPMAVPLAVIVFLTAFVPILGAILSGALAVLVALVTEGFITAVLVLGVVLLVQQIESQILQPFILGRLVRVHPLAVVLTVTAGTLLAGIPGAVVAVPLVAVLNTVVTYLSAYHDQVVVRSDPRRSGATIAALAPGSESGGSDAPASDPGARPGSDDDTRGDGRGS
ncbi:AI-2E family transporter [Streptomyces sp. ST2-7A]|uniref:AI-2E family transporter n=1 Tax=Streptomyces sp. ST2-7A TaxID=2907214 RepID=UPI001F2C8E85|nr:AI-2E family transporter [Streptomyces sp. ST2-7A]MCE7082114.1 AI-2E family transporter [Streptomyces sp. ST2-7A]